ncbi:MAG: GNAT family N-acetyltransferase [Porticoccaceae bacterium]
MSINYKINQPISTTQFIALLKASTLAERRPVDDPACIQGMLANANLCVSAWSGEQLIGIARSMTDFHYACYLSDLAVHRQFQRSGIGKRLLALSQEQLGAKCKLILISAPAANPYYQQLGFTNNQRCWVLERDQTLQ